MSISHLQPFGGFLNWSPRPKYQHTARVTETRNHCRSNYGYHIYISWEISKLGLSGCKKNVFLIHYCEKLLAISRARIQLAVNVGRLQTPMSVYMHIYKNSFFPIKQSDSSISRLIWLLNPLWLSKQNQLVKRLIQR